MRLLFWLFICFIFLRPTYSLGYAQIDRVNINGTFTLLNFFRKIEEQTGKAVYYANNVVNDQEKVTVNLVNCSVDDAMKKVLGNKDVQWIVEEQFVTIKKKEKPRALLGEGGDSTITVTGRVVNEKGEPIPGATVVVKGEKKGGTTGIDGGFVLKDVPVNAHLAFTNIAFLSQEISVNSRRSIGTIQLKRYIGELDETVVIAYGTTTGRYNTGNVAKVKSNEIEKQPVTNPLLTLQGRVPGLFITQAKGLSGSGVTVQIRGQNSLLNGNDPFYVVDGVPYTSQLLPSLNNGLLGNSGVNASQGGNPLSFINPADIESISILKDADATAIYGSRAANGAILITTKKGKAGKMKIGINIQEGWGNVIGKLNMLNTQQYLQMRHEALRNDGIDLNSPPYNDPSIQKILFSDIVGVWDTTRYTDWQKTLIGGTAKYSNVSATISGGNESVQYILGGTFRRETTVFPGNFSDEKGAMHFNINGTSENKRFKVQMSGNYIIDNNQLPYEDLTGKAVTLPPNAPALYDNGGNINWALDSDGKSTWISAENPIAPLLNRYKNRTTNLISNGILSYHIFDWLDVQSNFGYTSLQSSETAIFPLIAFAPQKRSTEQRGAQYGNNIINSWIIEPQVTFQYFIGQLKINALIGSTIQQNKSKGSQIGGSGYNSDNVLEDVRSASVISVNSSITSVYKYNALYGRIGGVLNDKYLINISARRDGSSRFGYENRFHNFGALGVGWIFSNEPLLDKISSFFSFGKLRASYGTTGNDQIPNYRYLSLYSPVDAGIAFQGVKGLVPNNLTNPFLQWEETKKTEVGLELGFIKDRILFNASYYLNRSSNQLLNYDLPIITGFDAIIKNFPAKIQNSGLEFILNSINVKKVKFTWSTSINLTIPKNKLLDFPGLENSSYTTRYIVGEPITIFRVYHFKGVDPEKGIYQVADNKGIPTDNPSDPKDKIIILNRAPKFYGGFQNTISYKGFQFDFLFQFVKQIAQNYKFGLLPGRFGINQPTSVLDRWQSIGDNNSIQKFSSNFSLFSSFFNGSGSDAAYTDASYIRLKTLSLSWQFPEGIIKKMHVSNCRFYFQGQNLFTLSPYKGLDPEVPGVSALPPLRMLTIGIQIEL